MQTGSGECLKALGLSAKGENGTAWGNAPGKVDEILTALKARNKELSTEKLYW